MKIKINLVLSLFFSIMLLSSCNNGEEDIYHEKINEIKNSIQKKGGDADAISEVLYNTILNGRSLEYVKYIFKEYNPDVNYVFTNQDIYGKTYSYFPLGTAAMKGDLEVVKYLVLEKHANLETKNHNDKTALHLAISEYDNLYQTVIEDHNLNVVNFLISHGANVNVKAKGDSKPMFMIAYEKKHHKISFALIKTHKVARTDIDYKSNMNIFGELGQNTRHRTLLALTSTTGEYDFVKELLGLGADVNGLAVSSQTPLSGAAGYYHLDIVKLLVEKGADIDSKVQDATKEGNTPLTRASYDGYIDIVKYLALHGADKEGKTTSKTQGGTPFYEASGRGHLDVVQYLVEDVHVATDVTDTCTLRNCKKPVMNALDYAIYLNGSGENDAVINYLKSAPLSMQPLL